MEKSPDDAGTDSPPPYTPYVDPQVTAESGDVKSEWETRYSETDG